MNPDSQADQLMSKDFVLLTVCTPNFIPGTLTMLYSFLKYNPWYKGDIIVMVDEIDPAMQKYLPLIPNLKIHIVSEALSTRAEAVVQNHTSKKIFRSVFYSIELFNLPGYKKYIFIDSDTLVLGSFLELCQRAEPMLCVGDSVFYKDQLRRSDNYQQAKPKFWENKKDFWGDTFNSGVVIYDASLITPKAYQDMLDMIDITGYPDDAARLQDQLIQNIYLRGKYTLVSAKYNYRFGIADEILEKDQVSFDEAVVLHYTARKKPWLFNEALDRVTSNKNYLRPFLLWQQHWTEFFEVLHGRLK